MKALIIQHIASEGPGLVQEVLENKGWGMDIRYMDKNGKYLPKSLEAYQAFIVLGGGMAAYEEQDYPYLLDIQNLIREAVRIKVPTLGICLGAQLIARALGAHVGKNPVMEIGWYPLRLTVAGRKTDLFAGLPEEFLVFQWHRDTFSLPEKALLLAQGKTCLNQAFVFNEHIWALQFHPEVTPGIIANWTEMYKDDLIEFGGYTEKKVLMRKTKKKWQENRMIREILLKNIEKLLNPNK